MNKLERIVLASLAILLCTCGLAQASPVVLKFEGIAPYPNNSDVYVQQVLQRRCC